MIMYDSCNRNEKGPRAVLGDKTPFSDNDVIKEGRRRVLVKKRSHCRK